MLRSEGGLYFGAGKNLEVGSFLNALLDDVKIYAKFLSEEEVGKLYTEGSIGPYIVSPESPVEPPPEPPITPTPFVEDFEAGSLGELWSSYGDENWSVTSHESYSGAYSARAGDIGDDENSSLETTLDCTSGDVSFYRRVSSESRFDYLRFYINGVEQGEWSGDLDWGRESYSVGEGTHTFTWEYSKDGSVSEGEDTAWIDYVSFPIEQPVK